jgi:hypothetical protein
MVKSGGGGRNKTVMMGKRPARKPPRRARKTAPVLEAATTTLIDTTPADLAEELPEDPSDLVDVPDDEPDDGADDDEPALAQVPSERGENDARGVQRQRRLDAQLLAALYNSNDDELSRFRRLRLGRDNDAPLESLLDARDLLELLVDAMRMGDDDEQWERVAQAVQAARGTGPHTIQAPEHDEDGDRPTWPPPTPRPTHPTPVDWAAQQTSGNTAPIPPAGVHAPGQPAPPYPAPPAPWGAASWGQAYAPGSLPPQPQARPYYPPAAYAAHAHAPPSHVPPMSSAVSSGVPSGYAQVPSGHVPAYPVHPIGGGGTYADFADTATAFAEKTPAAPRTPRTPYRIQDEETREPTPPMFKPIAPSGHVGRTTTVAAPESVAAPRSAGPPRTRTGTLPPVGTDSRTPHDSTPPPQSTTSPNTPAPESSPPPPPVRGGDPDATTQTGRVFRDDDGATTQLSFASRAHALAMTVDQYAALCAERDLFPERTREVERRFDVQDARLRAVVDRLFELRFERDPTMRSRWQDLYASHKTRLR